MVSFKSAPEYVGVVEFALFCEEDDRTHFTHEDLAALNYRTGTRVSVLKAELEMLGLTLAHRANEKRVRGFTTSSSDRWFGPGSCKTHGGAAYTSMMVAKYGSKDMISG